MDAFKQLVYLLEAELLNQKKFFELLTQEQVAIVKVNPEQLEAINEKKVSLLDATKELEEKRTAAIATIKPVTNRRERVKFAEIIDLCPQANVKLELTKVGNELRETAKSVQELNKLNAELVKHSLGLISSTLAIMVSNTENELPSYSKSGKIEAREEKQGRSRTLV